MAKSFTKPHITLAGVPIDSPNFQWPMLAGVRSGKTTFQLTQKVAKDVMSKKNPVELKIICDVFDGVVESKNRKTFLKGSPQAQGSSSIKTRRIVKVFKNLYLLEMKGSDNPYIYYVEVGDQRHFWEHLLVSREYNIHRKTNERRRVDFAAGLESAATQIFFGTERYAQWSLKKDGEFRFTNAGSIDTPTGTPWTAMDVVRNLLEQEMGLKYGGKGNGKYRFEKKPFDNLYQVENLTWEMSSTSTALSQVLGMAQADIYQHPDGEIVIYDIKDNKAVETLFSTFKPMDGSGWPIKQDLKNVRPGKIRALIPQEYELRFDFAEGVPGGSSTPRNAIPFTLDNVIQIPTDTEIAVGNSPKKMYAKGSWVPIKDYINAISFLPGPGIRRGKILDRDALLKHWFTDQLKYIWVTDFAAADQVDHVWAKRIGAIRAHYRQTFQIRREWIDRIRSWQPVRATVLDPISGTRQPSPVFVNYCVIPSFRYALYGQNRKKHKAAYNVTGWSAKLADVNPSPFTIQVIDKEAGILKIQYAQDTQQLVSTVIPSNVEGIPVLSAGSNPKSTLWNRAKLASEHHMSVIISAVLSEPNDEGRHFIRNFELSNSNKDKTFDMAIRQDNARWEWTDATTATLRDDRVVITGSTLANEDIVKALAEASAKRLQESWRDLITGTFTQPAYDDAWVPSSTMRSVTIKFSKNRGLETMFNMAEKPPRFDIYELLPQSVRNYLYKHIPQG